MRPLTELQRYALEGCRNGKLIGYTTAMGPRTFYEYRVAGRVVTSQLKALRKRGLIRFMERGERKWFDESTHMRFRLTAAGEAECNS